MATIATLEARYTANIIQFDRELKKMSNINKRATDKVLADHKRASKDTEAVWAKTNIGGALSKSLGSGLGNLKGQLLASITAITSGAGAAAAIGLADTFNRFTNSLKVAGVQGAALAQVQDRLFAAANRHGTSIESLGQLYGRVAQSATELGVSQSQILTVTDAVSAAIRVSGQPISAASGAMLQMSQALGAGTVRAEEFNSMMEGMLPLIQAAAGASTKYGGSVAKMRTDVLAGKLSSKEFFDLIVAGSASLEAKAAKSTLTVAQSFEILKNKMVEAVGATNETWGITDRLSEALKWLSENIETVGDALLVVAGALSITLAPAVGRAAVSLAALTAGTVSNGAAMMASIPGVIGLTAGLNGITPAAAGARMALTALSTATGIGLAITAISIAVGAFALQSYKAAEASRQLTERVNSKKAALDEAKKAADQARVETGNLSKAEMDALTKTASLTGEVDILTTAYGRLAVEAKRARLEILATQATEARQDYKKAEKAYNERQDQVRRNAQGPGYYGGADGRQPAPLGMDRVVTDVTRDTMAGSKEAKTLADSRAVMDAAYGEYNGARDANASTFLAPTTPSTTSGGSKGSKSSGTSAEDRAKNSADAIAQAERQLRDATRAQAITAAERHQVSIAALADDHAMAVEKIKQREKEKEITPVAAARLIELEGQIRDAKLATETAARQRELDEAARELAQLRNDNLLEAARLDAEELSDKASLATTREERHDYERQALEAQQRADRLMFDSQQEALKLQLQKNGHAQAEIDAALKGREDNFNRAQAGSRDNQSATQKKENGPQTMQEWVTAFGNAEAAGQSFNQKLFSIAEGGISDLTSGITDAIMGAKSFSEAFSDMARSIIAQMIKMAVQFVIFEMLGRAFGVPGLGKQALGIASNKKAPSHAMGTNYAPGGPSFVSDNELINLPSGSQVVPAGVVKQAMSVRSSGRGQQNFNLTTVVNAEGAVMRDHIREEIAQAYIMAVQDAKKGTLADLANRERNRLR